MATKGPLYKLQCFVLGKILPVNQEGTKRVTNDRKLARFHYLSILIILMKHFNYRLRSKYNGRLYFQFVCLFTWGIPHLHPIILPLIPGPFSGGISVTGPRSLPGGYARTGVPEPGLGNLQTGYACLLLFPSGGLSCSILCSQIF